MTLREHEQHRARFATRKHLKQIKRKNKKKWQSALDAPFALANPYQA